MKPGAVPLLASIFLVASHFVGRADDDRANGIGLERFLQLQTLQVEKDEDAAIALLSDPKMMERYPRSALWAFRYLERTRSIKAVPVLCDRLLFEQKAEEYRSAVWYDLKCPAFPALVAIGKPAAEGLLLKIATTETSHQYRDLASFVIAGALKQSDLVGIIESFERESVRHRTSKGFPKHDQYRNYEPARLARFKEECRPESKAKK
jgi:hypothetical protein